jgi:hypothetical protein
MSFVDSLGASMSNGKKCFAIPNPSHWPSHITLYQGLFLASQAAIGCPYILRTFYTVTLEQVWIIPDIRCSRLMLFPATAMCGHLGVSTMEFSLLCRSLTMTKSANHGRPKHVSQRTSRSCVLMQWMVVDGRDRWPTRSHCHLRLQWPMGSWNSSNV